MYYNLGTTGSTTQGWHTCGGKQIFCDGQCTRCDKAEVLFSNKNQTTSDCTSIHIVRRPK